MIRILRRVGSVRALPVDLRQSRLSYGIRVITAGLRRRPSPQPLSPRNGRGGQGVREGRRNAEVSSRKPYQMLLSATCSPGTWMDRAFRSAVALPRSSRVVLVATLRAVFAPSGPRLTVTDLHRDHAIRPAPVAHLADRRDRRSAGRVAGSARRRDASRWRGSGTSSSSRCR
jgi:hypothetical protein